MPDRRTHRGAHPEDCHLFGRDMWWALREATADLSWLQGRGYAPASARKLVGDRYRLEKRQRTAVARCACSDDARRTRLRRRMDPSQLRGREVWIDGYNVLTSVEAALAGGVILHARDGCFRDMASMHGSYRHVEETGPAIRMLGEALQSWRVQRCRWWLDQPVSNSGRLRSRLLAAAENAGWDWNVELVGDPDKTLSATRHIVASSDSVILDQCRHWLNLAACTIRQHVPQAWMVDLSLEAPTGNA